MNSRAPSVSRPPTPIDQTSVDVVGGSVACVLRECVASESCDLVRLRLRRTRCPRMKDKSKDPGSMMQEPKAEVKCAEVRSTGPRFKIGEYNRATASFEMGSRDEVKPRFDLSADGGVQYFKSSFARSMVVNSSRGSKSLDYAFPNRQQQNGSPAGRNGCDDRFWMPGKENWDLRRAQPAEIRDDESTTGSLISEQPSSMKKSEVIEEHLRSQGYLGDHSGAVERGSSSCQRFHPGGGDRRLDDVLLRSPLTASCRSSFHRSQSSASDVDSVMLQSQVTTLQWQLRQAEASRQMYRAVMEQVVSFLQKTHKDLDVLQSRLDEDAENVTSVSRSRSVHAVDTSPTRASSTRSEATLSFQKAKSFAQIAGADPDCPKHGAMFREVPWRKTRKQQHDNDEVIPSKISEEAFRLLRTVKSLLSTREPDLASRLSTSCSSPANVADVSSASSTVSATLDSDQGDFRGGKEPRAKGEGRRRSKGEVEAAKGSPPQLSISSADDESGFSSLNSFQEIGVPVTNSTFEYSRSPRGPKPRTQSFYPEVGLPKVEDCKVHRRWSSTPADPKLKPPSLCTNGDVIKVLWV